MLSWWASDTVEPPHPMAEVEGHSHQHDDERMIDDMIYGQDHDQAPKDLAAPLVAGLHDPPRIVLVPLAASIRLARKATPLRSPMVHGEATRPLTLTWVP